jgi:hypothetical protein
LLKNKVYGDLHHALLLIEDGVFGVSLDTHLSVQQFASSKDTSIRDELQTFLPFIGFNTWDMYTPNYESDNWQEKLLPKYLYQFGQLL